MGSEPQDPDLNWDFVQALHALHSPTRHRPQKLEDGSERPIPVATEPAGVKSSSSTSVPCVDSNHETSDAWKFESLWNILHADVLDWGEPSSNKTQLDDIRSISSDKTLRPSKRPRPSNHTVLERPLPDNSFVKNFQELPASGVSKIPPTVLPFTSRTTKPAVKVSPTSDSSAAVKILKSPAKKDHNTSSPLPVQNTRKQILNPDQPGRETSKSSMKLEMAKKAKQANNNDITLSESSAEAESDSSNIVFDRPLSRKPGVLFVPSQVGTLDVRNECSDTPPSSYEDADTMLKSDKVKDFFHSSRQQCITSKHTTPGERRVSLMTKLIQNFPEYAELILQLGNTRISKKLPDPRPIHVFVDMSNVLIGFHNSAKAARDIPMTTRIRRLHMSFANFSLIMERGRLATKRVLVGSDRVPSIVEAEELGYEANILDRVHKSKHTPPRYSKLHKIQRFGRPEMAGAPEERWVEQGVDEILHLKILESLLDTNEPATIVLATGDAAEAEYSGGFMCMVERALQRDWNVELVSFSQLTSYAYRKKDFRAKWGHRFRMIELDEYVEELFE